MHVAHYSLPTWSWLWASCPHMYITTGGQFITQDMTLGEIQIPSLPEIRNFKCAYTTVSQAPQCVTVMCNKQEAAEPA